MSRRIGLIGLAAAAAAGFRGVLLNLGATMDRYAQRAGRSTAQATDSRFPKHPPGTVAQAKRAAIKTKNRAKHRRAVRGNA